MIIIKERNCMMWFAFSLKFYGNENVSKEAEQLSLKGSF